MRLSLDSTPARSLVAVVPMPDVSLSTVNPLAIVPQDSQAYLATAPPTPSMAVSELL